jgi:FKBP-type peptidyl-prolyl cis-trans isomerase
MSLGSKIRLHCPKDWGYGTFGFEKEDGTFLIPPRANLTLEIELKKILHFYEEKEKSHPL